MYREQYGEYAYWCWGAKGLIYNMNKRQVINLHVEFGEKW